jgi:hypothetical protein
MGLTHFYFPERTAGIRKMLSGAHALSYVHVPDVATGASASASASAAGTINGDTGVSASNDKLSEVCDHPLPSDFVVLTSDELPVALVEDTLLRRRHMLQYKYNSVDPIIADQATQGSSQEVMESEVDASNATEISWPPLGTALVPGTDAGAGARAVLECPSPLIPTVSSREEAARKLVELYNRWVPAAAAEVVFNVPTPDSVYVAFDCSRLPPIAAENNGDSASAPPFSTDGTPGTATATATTASSGTPSDFPGSPGGTPLAAEEEKIAPHPLYDTRSLVQQAHQKLFCADKALCPYVYSFEALTAVVKWVISNCENSADTGTGAGAGTNSVQIRVSKAN